MSYFISFDEADSDLLGAATYLAERIKSADAHAEAMVAIVPRYLAKDNADLAAELANTVDDPFTRDKLLILVAEKCAEMDDDDYVLQLADAVEEHGLRAQARERIALEKVKKGQIEKAMEVAGDIEHPDYVAAAAAVRLAKDGQKDAADEILVRIEYARAAVFALQARAMNEHEAGNNAESISLLDRAKETAAEIEHNEERIRTYCEIGNHLVEARRSDLAIGAYDAARVDAEQLDNVHRDSLIAASALGFLHAGSVDLADRTLDLVTDKTQMANCLLAFARHYWEKDERDDALDALDEAYQILRSQRDIETRDSRARYALFGAVAAQFAGFEKGERAIEIAQTIEDENQRTNALTEIASVLTIRKDDGLARDAINTITEQADRALALIGMSDAKQQNGDREAAIEMLDEAAQLIEDVPQFSVRADVYIGLVHRFTDYGEKTRAREMLSAGLRTTAEIRDESRRVALLATLSDLLDRNKELELTDNDKLRVKELLARA